MDTAGGTFTIGERTFHVTKTSTLTKQKKSLSLKDIAVGDWVTGSYRKATNGNLVVNTLYHGGKMPVSPAAGTNSTRSTSNPTNKVDAPTAKPAR